MKQHCLQKLRDGKRAGEPNARACEWVTTPERQTYCSQACPQHTFKDSYGDGKGEVVLSCWICMPQ